MFSPTYLQLKTYLEKELDLEDETFITADEFLSYFNEAVDMIEAAVHTIYADYFLTKAYISLVSGTSTYTLPSDIYAQKIRQIFYDDGSETNKFEVRQIKQLIDIPYIQSTDSLRYLMTNDSTNGVKINFYPAPAVTASQYVTIWYLRNAKRFTQDTDVCDIPEFTNVVVAFVRWKCLAKEGHPDMSTAAQDLERLRQEMVETLTDRVPDEHNEIIKDIQFYADFDTYLYGGIY